jgi:hypothetical protein
MKTGFFENDCAYHFRARKHLTKSEFCNTKQNGMPQIIAVKESLTREGNRLKKNNGPGG